MSFFGDLRHTPAATKPPGIVTASGGADPRVPLLNLSAVRERVDSLHKFLCDSVNSNTLLGKHETDRVSAEITAAIHQIIVNGVALLATTQAADGTDSKCSNQTSPSKLLCSETGLLAPKERAGGEDSEIIELDAVELLAEHIHFCEICGKGFKRDANLRMHMRAHGNQFKTPEALAKPPEKCSETIPGRPALFSCPFPGCSRNKSHNKFRPLKSAICVKNHFKRSHCPKMYSCNRCNKKSFSVMADLKSHMKHCGISKWKCSCRTSFSRKDKLFSHIALFEGHMPTVEEAADMAAPPAREVEEGIANKDTEMAENSQTDNSLLDRLLDDFNSIENFCFQDPLFSASPMMDNFFSF
ncbi:PREDICTED: protein SENSITIVE TO PROTON RHIZOTOXICITY 1-like [Ipomoea nil]|uniref:protein SENSITIVE TO PROTON RHIZOTOXICITY 1-like n=1 Tax=Ipomoea nil TaxID=35883 RepID=UPI0009008FF5|nr:PREDICTED: protein SENSITIVE TO PROTON RHIZOTOXICITY 1-like [Ipomoea nil]